MANITASEASGNRPDLALELSDAMSSVEAVIKTIRALDLVRDDAMAPAVREAMASARCSLEIAHNDIDLVREQLDVA